MKNLSLRKRGKRAALEFYSTPPEATRALLSVEKFDGDIWEPACGNGAISKVLIKAEYKVVSTDLAQRDFGQGGHDFLKSIKPLAKNIVTNPPYGTHGLADAFIRKALIHAKKIGGKGALATLNAHLSRMMKNGTYGLERPMMGYYKLKDNLVESKQLL